jgi:hypothetical protein
MNTCHLLSLGWPLPLLTPSSHHDLFPLCTHADLRPNTGPLQPAVPSAWSAASPDISINCFFTSARPLLKRQGGRCLLTQDMVLPSSLAPSMNPHRDCSKCLNQGPSDGSRMPWGPPTTGRWKASKASLKTQPLPWRVHTASHIPSGMAPARTELQKMKVLSCGPILPDSSAAGGRRCSRSSCPEFWCQFLVCRMKAAPSASLPHCLCGHKLYLKVACCVFQVRL